MKNETHKTNKKKKELLISQINKILEVLSDTDCERIYYLVSGLFLS